MKKLFYFLGCLTLIFGCTLEESFDPINEDLQTIEISEPTLKTSTLGLEFTSVDFAAPTATGKSAQSAKSSTLEWNHIFGGEGTLLFSNTSAQSPIDSLYTVDMAEFAESGDVFNLINGQYSVSLNMFAESGDVSNTTLLSTPISTPLPYVPVDASETFFLSEDSSLALTGTTSYGLLIVNPYLVSESVTPTFNMDDIDYPLAQDLDQDGNYYLYIPGGSSGKLTLQEDVFGGLASKNVEITANTIEELTLVAQSSQNSLTFSLEAFSVESEDFLITAPSLTIVAPEGAEVGSFFELNGKVYEVVDNDLLRTRIGEDADMTYMCTTLVTDMYELFYNSDDDTPIEFTGDLTQWDVSSVSNTTGMFVYSTFNQDIGNWDVSSVTEMNGMFRFSSFNQNIGNWDVSNVEYMAAVFDGTPFDQDIRNWDVSKVKVMEALFSNSLFNQDISNWDVSNVEYMYAMFEGTPFNQNIGNWDVSNVKDMGAMFTNTPFNQDISNWNTSKNIYTDFMFKESDFNQDIGNWDVSNVVFMSGMFEGSPFNQNISQWNVDSVTDCSNFSTGSDLEANNSPIFINCSTSGTTSPTILIESPSYLSTLNSRKR